MEAKANNTQIFQQRFDHMIPLFKARPLEEVLLTLDPSQLHFLQK